MTNPSASAGGWLPGLQSRLQALVAADQDRTRHGYNQLVGRYWRIGLVLMVVSSLAGLFVDGVQSGIRLGVLVFCTVGLMLLWWTRHRVPSLPVRIAVIIGITIWITVRAVSFSRTGWPYNLDLLPVAAAVVAIAATWWMAIAALALPAIAVGITYATGSSPSPAYLPQIAGNWLACAISMLYLVRQLLRAFDAGADDLITSAKGLEAMQQEATELSASLAAQVRADLEALAASLSRGRDAARDAAATLLERLQESRQRIPAEPTLLAIDWQKRLREIRVDLARTLTVAGVIIFALQIARHWWFGLTDIMLLVGGHLLAMLLLLAFHVRYPRFWRWTIHAAAGISVLIGLLNLPNWAALETGATIPPLIPITLLLLINLGVVSGDRGVMILWPVLLCGGAVAQQGLSAWPSLVVGADYAVLGLLLTSLLGALLATITQRRQEATAAILRRRRLIGTMFHDLANPLQALLLELEADRPAAAVASARARARPDPAALVKRMQATLNVALGQQQPAERLLLNDLLDAILNVFSVRLAAKRLSLVPAWDPELSVLAIRSILQDTVLANLVSNAIKFSPTGSTIAMRASRSGDRVTLEIQNAGDGMPDEVLAAFAAGRVAPSRAGSAGEAGSGHGLLLTRDYLEDMGGQLTFDRPSDGGVLARVVLPAA